MTNSPNGELNLSCVFCGQPTNFEDQNKTYCIDCYCKLHGVAHVHDIVRQPAIFPSPEANISLRRPGIWITY